MTTHAHLPYGVGDQAAAIAGFGIPGSLTELPTRPLAGGAWLQLLSEVRRHRLTGLLAAAVADGAMPVTPEQAEDVLRLRAGARATTVRLDLALTQAARVLQEAAVEVRVLDGSAVARLDYADPTLSSVDSLDLLVRPEQRTCAEAALMTHGWRRTSGTCCFTTADGVRLTVRCSLPSPSPRDRAGSARLWEQSELLDVDGRSLNVLPREERLLVGSGRVAGDAQLRRLGPLRDIAQATLHRDLDAPRALALAGEYGAETTLAEAVRSAWSGLRLADVVALSAWAHSHWTADGEPAPAPTGNGEGRAASLGRIAHGLAHLGRRVDPRGG